MHWLRKIWKFLHISKPEPYCNTISLLNIWIISTSVNLSIYLLLIFLSILIYASIDLCLYVCVYVFICWFIYWIYLIFECKKHLVSKAMKMGANPLPCDPLPPKTDHDDDEIFVWDGWPTNSRQPYFQKGPLSGSLTIVTSQHEKNGDRSQIAETHPPFIANKSLTSLPKLVMKQWKCKSYRPVLLSSIQSENQGFNPLL